MDGAYSGVKRVGVPRRSFVSGVKFIHSEECKYREPPDLIGKIFWIRDERIEDRQDWAN
jgi:hypothetical protein